MHAGVTLFSRGVHARPSGVNDKSYWQFHRVRPALSNCIYQQLWQPLHVHVWNAVARGLPDSGQIKLALLNLPQDSD